MKFIPLFLLSPLLSASLMAANVSDSEIAEILHVANSGEVAAGKLAVSKAVSKDVKEFANTMVKEHQSMDDEAAGLAKTIKLTRQSSGVSRALQAESEKGMTALKAKSAAEFDAAYIDAQVMDHEKVLATIDQTLLPSARNAQLKEMLTKARPRIQEHLQHAQRLQADRKKSL